MGDFNLAIDETVQGVVGPHGLGRRTNHNWDRLVSFATNNGMRIANILPLQAHPPTTWHLLNPRAEPNLKDSVLVRCRLRPSFLDTHDDNSDHRLVVLSLRLKLQQKVNRRPQKSFDAQLCKAEDYRREYIE